MIFGNEIDQKTIKRAAKNKQKYLKKYGDDTCADYKLSFSPIDTLDFMGAQNIVFGR